KHRYPAMETSFANGGQLSASNAETWTHWSTVLKGLKWLLRKDAPLLVNRKPSWHKLSWFAQFLASIPHYRDSTVETARLAEAEGIDFDCEKRGILHIYRDRAGFEHAAEVTKLLAAGGLERRAVTPEEMRAIEPTLAGNYYGGFYTESDSTGDIHKFTVGLSAALDRMGVRSIFGRDVVALNSDGEHASVTTVVDGRQDVWNFDALMVCAGVASREFARQLGDRVNVYPVKGYSITVNLTDERSQRSAPWVSLLDDETKLVTSRLG